MGNVVVLGDWVTAICAMLYCEWLYYVRFGIVGLQAARCPVVRVVWYRRYSRYLLRLTVFFTATIYRDIPRPWRYWYRHVSIDDKYRGIAGIAQHYYLHTYIDYYDQRHDPFINQWGVSCCLDSRHSRIVGWCCINWSFFCELSNRNPKHVLFVNSG